MGIAVSPQILPQVAEFIDKPRKMLINGKWVNAASGKTFPTTTLRPVRSSRRSRKAIAKTLNRPYGRPATLLTTAPGAG